MFNAPQGSSLKTAVDDLAQQNEVGFYNPNYFSEGTYSAGYTYILHPPIEYDTTTSHLNLKFAGSSHIPYHNVRITVPADKIDQVFAYPPSLSTQKTGNSYSITGSFAADETLAVEMLGPADGFSQISGFRSAVSDIRGKTGSASFWYNLPYYAAYLLNALGKIAVIAVPFYLVFVYYRYGREKEFTVPAYLVLFPERTSNHGRSTCCLREMRWISTMTVIMQRFWISTGGKISPSRKKEKERVLL